MCQQTSSSHFGLPWEFQAALQTDPTRCDPSENKYRIDKQSPSTLSLLDFLLNCTVRICGCQALGFSGESLLPVTTQPAGLAGRDWVGNGWLGIFPQEISWNVCLVSRELHNFFVVFKHPLWGRKASLLWLFGDA